MSKITATQADPSTPNPEDWRPTPTNGSESGARASFLKEWGVGEDKPAPPTEPDGDDDLDETAEDEDDVEEDAIEAPASKPAKVAKKPAPKVEPDEDEDEKPDDDSDLDEDEKPDEEAAEPAVTKGLAKLQKQERHMRQQFDRERETARAELARDRAALKAEQDAAGEAKSQVDRLKARAKVDPLGVLEELGFDDFEYAGKQAYLRTKAATDPAHKEVAARMQRDRERDRDLDEVKKKLAAREQTDEEAKKTAALHADTNAYLGDIAKDAKTFAKATLTQKLIATADDVARARFAQAASDLWQQNGSRPTPRQVVVAVEKMERAHLRRYGIDPRTLASAPTAGKATAANGKAAKGKPAKGKAAVREADEDDELKMPSKNQLLNEDWSS